MSNSRSPTMISCAAVPRRSPAIAERLDPADRFLLFNRARPARPRRLGGACPDARMHDAEQRLVVDIDRYHRMTEKTRRFAVAGRSETPPPAMPAAEIDLGGVLRRYDPPSGAGRRRSVPCGLEDFLRASHAPMPENDAPTSLQRDRLQPGAKPKTRWLPPAQKEPLPLLPDARRQNSRCGTPHRNSLPPP